MHQDLLSLPGVETWLFEDQAAVATATAGAIVAAAQQAIAERGRFRLCMAGGTTPTAAYQQLVGIDTDWTRWWLYLGDERCAPNDDETRNSVAIDTAWLSHVPVPRTQVLTIPADAGAEAGARLYEPTVRAALPFDLVLLGVGEDGHTASLFPGRKISDERLVMPVHEAPKPPPDRVSLSAKALSETARMLVLVTGGGKADALKQWQRGVALPIVQVAAAGKAKVLVDRDAAAGILAEARG